MGIVPSHIPDQDNSFSWSGLVLAILIMMVLAIPAIVIGWMLVNIMYPEVSFSG